MVLIVFADKNGQQRHDQKQELTTMSEFDVSVGRF